MLRRTAIVILCSLPFATWWTPSVTAAENTREALEVRLKKEFLDMPVVSIQEGLYTGEYTVERRLFGFEDAWSWSILYSRVSAERAEREKQAWQKCCTPLGDGRTFQFVAGAYRAAPLTQGERLKIVYVKLLDDAVRLVIQADQSKHGGAGAASTMAREIGGGGTTNYHNQWGFAYNFFMERAILDAGDYDRVVSEIHQVLLPPEEAMQKLKGNARPAPSGATKKFEIKLGMTREEVISGLGTPQQSVVAGSKELLKFSEISVVMENGKVIEVKF